MKKPKLKEIHGALFLKDRIRISSGFGYASEIKNPDDKFTLLIKTLDGSYNIDEIIEKCSSQNLTKKDILEAIDMLFKAGYLEDAEMEIPSELTQDELERYKVNINFFNTLDNSKMSKYDYQVKLKNSHVSIFGLGGIGSNICIALLELGVGKITAVEFDVVEPSNLNRQLLYSTSSIGKSKAEEARKRVAEFNPNVEFNVIEQRINSVEDVRQILTSHPCDVVVNVADFPTGYIDYWVNEACVEKNVPIFSAVVAKKQGRIYSVVPNETACFNCQYLAELERCPKIADEVEETRIEIDTDLGYYRSPNGALGPTCLFHGYFISYEILRYLLFGSKSLLTFNKRFDIDFLSFETSWHDLKRMESCEVCNKTVKDTNHG